MNHDLRILLHEHDNEVIAERDGDWHWTWTAIGIDLAFWIVLGGAVLGIYYGLPLLVRVIA